MAALDQRTLGSLRAKLPLPEYDRASATAGVVHIGVGGFHRSHQAMYHDRLLAAGELEWGICGVGLLPADRRMKEVLGAQDGLYTLVVKHPDGRYEPRVIGSILEYLFAPDEPDAVLERLTRPQTRIVSLTMTEGGYDSRRAGPGSAFGLVTAALARRRAEGAEPFTVLSCDNLIDNGDIAREAFCGYAERDDPDLGAWMRESVAFPNSVVDRITPGTTQADRDELRDRVGLEDRWPVVCEPFAQWVLEDVVRDPPYTEVGAQIVADVRPYEAMKLRLLNAGHQTVAYFGRLCGHAYVHEAARDPDVQAFLEGYLIEEATPTLSAVPAGQVEAFRDLVPKRFANPAIGDTIERIALNASDRIPKFVLPVVVDQLRADGELRRSAAVVAAWARCLEGTDEAGEPIVVADALAEDLVARARGEHMAFIEYEPVFGDLAGDDRFAGAYLEARRSLAERGARATLAALA